MSKTTIKKLLLSMTKAQFDVSVGTSAASVSVFENVKRYNVKTVVGRTRVCQNSLILKKSQSPDFHKPGLCYV